LLGQFSPQVLPLGTGHLLFMLGQASFLLLHVSVPSR
jgi:hypothetical protein